MALFGNNTGHKSGQDFKKVPAPAQQPTEPAATNYAQDSEDFTGYNASVQATTPEPLTTQATDTHFAVTSKPMDFTDQPETKAPTPSYTAQETPTYEQPATPKVATPSYPEQPAPSMPTASGYPWKQTQRNLLNIQQQEQKLKEQLKQELLDQRSFLKHDLRRQKTVLLNNATKVGDPAQQIQTQIDAVNDGLVQWFGTKKIANHVFFNKKRRYYLLTDTLSTSDDFVQQGTLQQLKLLFDGMQMTLGHISTDYNDRLSQTAQQLKQQHLLAKNAHLINKYQDLQEYNKNLERKVVEVPITEHMSTVHDSQSHGDKVYDADQQLIMVIYYQNDKQIHVIEHYRDNVMTSRDILDHNGAISATQYFDQGNSSRIIRENFYRTDGSLVLIKSYQDNEPYIQLLSRSNVLMAIFNSELELTLWWLKNQIFDTDTTILIPVSSPLYQPLVTAKNLKVELMPILDHYEANTEITDQLMSDQAPIDSLLVLQDEAKRYIEHNAQHDIDISVLPAKTPTTPTSGAHQSTDIPAKF